MLKGIADTDIHKAHDGLNSVLVFLNKSLREVEGKDLNDKQRAKIEEFRKISDACHHGLKALQKLLLQNEMAKVMAHGINSYSVVHDIRLPEDINEQLLYMCRITSGFGNGVK